MDIVTVTSQHNDLSLSQGMRVRPSGRLLSVRNNPTVSLVTGTPAEEKPRATKSFRAWLMYCWSTWGLSANKAVNFIILIIIKRTVKSVYMLGTLVRMVPVRSSRFGDEAISELLKRSGRTLCDVRCSVHEVVAALIQTVPVHGDSFRGQLVPHSNDHLAIPQYTTPLFCRRPR